LGICGISGAELEAVFDAAARTIGNWKAVEAPGI
jgi:hypothetical protein